MTDAVCYVKTAEIRAAVEGRETDVLDRLGISWEKGAPHIDCPYPDHGGRDDWRWDPRKCRAFCTCIGKRHGEKRSHSIFDIVALIEDVDYDTAKIRVAKIIGRSDLIKTKSGGRGHQATDATSLLTPSPDNRDDDLVWIYLGYRLNVDPNCVPRPRTRAVGIQALAYFDPPPQKGKNSAKPILVATTPCAVFEQIDRAGCIHAHRIYLAAGGLGKADLGIDTSGKSREAKKSAKVIGGDNTSGRSVLWGDLETATLAILGEGIETSAALALAFWAEIEAGEIMVAACVSAAGIENFKPWPKTKKVIVAADRDEATRGGARAPSLRGEHAARVFGIRHHREFAGGAALPVSIALPGKSGESIDWLDILLRDGLAAVRTGVLRGAAFAPTATEIERYRTSLTKAERLKEVIKTYPLPHLDKLIVEFRYTPRDEIWMHKWSEKCDQETGERFESWTPIASPMGAAALLQLVGEDDAYGLRVLVEDMSGKPRTVDFERGELARLGASEIRARLFAAGLRVDSDGENICIQFLKAAKPPTLVTIVSRPGWHRFPGLPDRVFITPAGEAIGSPADRPIELTAAETLPDRVGRSGTIEGWQAAVRAAVTAENCPHWTLGAAAGFAGTIIQLTGLDTCGLNESGDTTLGKTTSQQIAVSAWSSPKQSDGGLLKSMRATENAMEAVARDSNGSILALDETAHADGKVIAKVIYLLAGDVGKARMRPDSSLRRPHTWSTFVLLSGEKSLEQKIRDDGGQWTGGMAVRFPDVDVTGINSRVAPETIDALKQIVMNYGHAGPAFVRALVANGLHREPDLLRERILTMAFTLAGSDTASPNVRAALPFAILAIVGSLAQDFGICPSEADVAGAIGWAWKRFCSSSDALAIDPDRQAVVNIQQYIAERWDVTIKNVEAVTGVNNREAVAWYDKDTIYLPTSRIAEAAGGVLKEQRIAGALDKGGHLARRGDPKRIAIRYVPKIGHVNCYALRRGQFGRPDEATEPYALNLVAGDE
jgi:hypothetical protein